MNDWLNIKGKTVLVTGASSGIGKAIVEELLELGVNVKRISILATTICVIQIYYL